MGLLIDENLSWDKHVERLMGRLNSGIYALSQMSFLSSPEIVRMIYFSHIHSHISYGLCLYGSTNKLNLNKILKIQKKAIRIILKLERHESVREHFKNLKILTVYAQYILDTITIAKNNEYKSNFQQLYNTRGRNHILPTHRLEFYTKKPSYMGLKFLKHVPQDIKLEQNINAFKTVLKNYLTDKVIYSFNEFLGSN